MANNIPLSNYQTEERKSDERESEKRINERMFDGLNKETDQ